MKRLVALLERKFVIENDILEHTKLLHEAYQKASTSFQVVLEGKCENLAKAMRGEFQHEETEEEFTLAETKKG